MVNQRDPRAQIPWRPDAKVDCRGAGRGFGQIGHPRLAMQRVLPEDGGAGQDWIGDGAESCHH